MARIQITAVHMTAPGTRHEPWIEVRVVNANPPYIQAYADGQLTDNLLIAAILNKLVHQPGGGL